MWYVGYVICTWSTTHNARDRVGVQFLLRGSSHSAWCTREGSRHAWLVPGHVSPKLTYIVKKEILPIK